MTVENKDRLWALVIVAVMLVGLVGLMCIH